MTLTPYAHSISTRVARRPLLGLALATVTAAAAQAQNVARPNAAMPEATQGQAAIDALGARLVDVAFENGMSTSFLIEQFRTDDSLRVDTNDRLFHVDPAALSEREREDPGPSGSGLDNIPLSSAFLLHSNPGADHTIYLDFTGHHSVNNSWGHNIMFPNYNDDGGAGSFTNSELFDIIVYWQHIAEDFEPFDNVDVTTEEPPLDRLQKTGGGDNQWGVRCLFTQPTSGFGSGIGGVAYLNSFDDSIDNPVFCFNKGRKTGAMTGSHEVGHALGLSHDGLNSRSYHPGTGSGATSWGPIMGAPFGASLVQWSIGDYAGSTNTQNDVNVITKSANGLTVKADDHSDVVGSGTFMDVGCPAAEVAVTGIIETRNDLDTFEFVSLGGNYRFIVDHAPVHRNLDIQLQIFDDLGVLVHTENGTRDPDVDVTLALEPGSYSAQVDGVGKTGFYSDYGTLGAYTITIRPLNGFLDLGNSLAGTKAVALTGQGFACPGDTVSLDMKLGLPNTIAFLAYGRGTANIPFKGGLIVPNTALGGTRTVITDGQGKASVAGPWPPGVPSGFEFTFQYWQPDPFGPQGWAATNAVKLTAP